MEVTARAIKKTIKYAARFGVRLSRKEIEERLLGAKAIKREKVSLELMKEKWQKKVRINEGGSRWKEEKMAVARKVAQKIGREVDEVILIGVTGSVAAGYPKKEDDIDLMIICKRDSMWYCRYRVRRLLALEKIPFRKYGRAEKGNEICINLWLDEIGMEIPEERRNIQTAVDLVLMKPVWQKERTYERWLKANNWAKKFVASPLKNKRKRINTEARVAAGTQKIDKKLANWLLFVLQYIYMRPKMRGELVGFHQAFFTKERKVNSIIRI